ncbi:hypothetical protein Tco_0736558 [Tanacetum coccineum]
MPRMKFNVLAKYLQQIMEESLPKMINDAITNHIPLHVDSSVMNYMSGHILHLQQDDLPIWLALKYKFEKLHVVTTPCRPSSILPRDRDDPHDDAHPEGENSAKRQKTSKHGTFVFRESSSGQEFESDQGPSMSGNQEKIDDFDFWTDSYATDDDEIPYEKVSHELMDEMLHTVDEEKLRKVVDEMLRQQCTSGDEHQYHIDHMQNFLKNDIMWESKKEIIILYLKKGSSGPEKIVMSLHKFPAVIFPDDDIEERTSRWVDNANEKKDLDNLLCPNESKILANILQNHPLRFNIPASSSVPWIYLGQFWHTLKEDGSKYRLKFVLDKKELTLTLNDFRTIFQLPQATNNNNEHFVNNKVDDYAETGLLWSLSVFIRSTVIWERVHDFQLGIKKYKVFSIVFEPVYGIIYKNSKKEKRVMRHQEVHKYVTPSLSNEDTEYLQLVKEEIEERLKHRDQMRR